MRAFATTACPCSTTAEPPTCSERDPHVPAPRGTTALSEWTTRTVSNGTPRIADAICAIAVSCPCPCGDTPVSTVTMPSACTCTEPNSFDANAVISTYVHTPMPSSRWSPRARRAACSARSSGTSAIRSASSSARS